MHVLCGWGVRTPQGACTLQHLDCHNQRTRHNWSQHKHRSVDTAVKFLPLADIGTDHAPFVQTPAVWSGRVGGEVAGGEEWTSLLAPSEV